MNAMLETAAPVHPRRYRINLPPGAYFHGAGLRAKIAALHAGGQPAHSVRQQTVALFRAALDQGRALARETLQANGGGLACAGHLADIEDELIGEIFNYVTAYVHPAADGPAGEAFVIAAVGGYGRATLAPGSDIDLLFLLSPAARPRGECIAEAILYMLWDLGQKVGHSTRLVKECLVHAREDMTVRTALLEARLILGDSKLFESMRTRFDR
ncbi:MAG: [protein-PII] uridylyltransferase, partial [Methylocella sp.]